MRAIGVIIFALAALVAAVLITVRLAAPQIAEYAAAKSLRDAGYEDVSVDVGSVTASSIVAGPIRAVDASSGQAISIDALSAEFNWRELLRDRRVRALAIGPGQVVAALDADGQMSVAGFSVGGGGETPGEGLPFDTLEIKELDVALTSPRGEGLFTLDGSLDDTAGAFSLAGEAPGDVGIDQASISNASFEARLVLPEDAPATLTAQFDGGIEAFGQRAEDVSVRVDGLAPDWRASLAGDAPSFEATIALERGTFDAAAAPEALATRLGVVTASGDLAVRVVDGRLVKAALGERPLQVRTGAEDLIVVAGGRWRAIVSVGRNGRPCAHRFGLVGRRCRRSAHCR